MLPPCEAKIIRECDVQLFVAGTASAGGPSIAFDPEDDGSGVEGSVPEVQRDVFGDGAAVDSAGEALVLMAGHGEKFGRKKEEAIAALLSQRSLEEAARAAGIGTRTLLRWMQVPEFSAAYRKARRDAVSQSTARLQQATGAAASTLLKVMVDHPQREPDRSRCTSPGCDAPVRLAPRRKSCGASRSRSRN
jgi:hypothetical protein